MVIITKWLHANIYENKKHFWLWLFWAIFSSENVNIKMLISSCYDITRGNYLFIILFNKICNIYTKMYFLHAWFSFTIFVKTFFYISFIFVVHTTTILIFKMTILPPKFIYNLKNRTTHFLKLTVSRTNFHS